jgi:hypothetical protein
MPPNQPARPRQSNALVIRQQAHDRRAASANGVAVASAGRAIAVDHRHDRRFLRPKALDIGAFDFWRISINRNSIRSMRAMSTSRCRPQAFVSIATGNVRSRRAARYPQIATFPDSAADGSSRPGAATIAFPAPLARVERLN